jgi:Dynein heavy chain region D6 P-loop domain
MLNHVNGNTCPRHRAGSDPTRLIEDLARRMKVKLHSVSMGQGQEALARKQLDVALAEGDWVLLQNTHLGLSLLPEVIANVTICTFHAFVARNNFAIINP